MEMERLPVVNGVLDLLTRAEESLQLDPPSAEQALSCIEGAKNLLERTALSEPKTSTKGSKGKQYTRQAPPPLKTGLSADGARI